MENYIDTDIEEKVLNKIKKHRIEKGYTHEYMAFNLKMSQASYAKLEANKTKLSLERLDKISKILETTIEDLLEVKTEKYFKQNLYDNSIIYQEIQNLNQESRELLNAYMNQVKEENNHLKGEIEFLRKLNHK
jgi:transcriptional regulator with XRE-family HTH domain